jgi:general secretion pathway protein F
MSDFFYKASDRAGKVVQGNLQAIDQAEVVAKLRSMGYIPIRINAAGAGKKPGRTLSFNFVIPNPFARVSARDLLPFTQALSTLIKAGLPLDRSLSIVAELTEQEQLRTITLEILKNIRGGKSLSEALSQHPGTFGRLYINMIRAGEAGGVLDVVLERLVEFLERSQDLKTTVINAITYPVLLISAMTVIVSILLVFVVPKFVEIFDTMGQELPMSTQMLLTISLIIKNYWWLLLGLGAGAYVWFSSYTRSEAGRRSFDALKLRVAIIKNIILKVEVARFSRTLGTLITSGVPLLQSLAIVKEVISNVVIADTVSVIHKAVKEGKGVSLPMKNTNVFPSLATHMIRVGEETGRMEEMLMRVAETYDRDVQNTIKRFVSLLEPSLILLMSVVVICIVMPIILAIFSINDVAF